ncbi:MAG TPA: SDR family NAD(P)-dependent oxidoreductase [Opitutaceae bacterium]|jgi:acyl-CoA synthetase (AMP-forming)/AMP-acid ligase II/thioesterase domain-containing protein/NAD(P)-dependent dehydrogenase (short-subunit alcohol dehydrogenase family)|nr:SDR family NAD(P)-dependent oxidoreductase [Opitutaceae bacterium]
MTIGYVAQTLPSMEPSEARGGALTLPAGHPTSLAGALERTAREFPSHGVVYLDGADGAKEQSYPALLDEAARMLGGLRAAGLKPGAPVLFQFEKNSDFIPAFWACALGGFVPVPISISPTYEQPHSILSKLRNAWTMLDSPLTLAGAGLAPRLQAWAEREALPGFRIETAESLRARPPADAWHPSRPDDLALLLLTSGSTGLPKAVRQTHGNLLAWAVSVVSFCKFTPADVSLNWMPLDHVGGLVMFHLRDVVLGCRQLHAPTEPVLQHPLIWLEWIERYRATITWAPNFAFGLINDQSDAIAQGRWNLSSLRFILNGGEAIVSKTARRFLSLLAPHGLPATAMRPSWGMSETCSSVTFSQRFTLAATSDNAAFVEVGEPIPGIQIRIVDEHDILVPSGKIGRLQIKGISITPGYHQNPEANQKSYTADGWFITGDLGVMKNGQLSITGREKDVIIINGVNFYSHEIESVVEEIDGVEISFTAACAIRLPGENTDQVAVFFCPTAAAEDRLPELIRTIRSTVSRKEGVAPDFIVPLTKADIPKTAIGKIQRAQLKQQFENGDFQAALARGQSAAKLNQTTPGWFYRRVWHEVALPVEGPLPEGPWLVFADELGLGQVLSETLRTKGQACTTVIAGPAFARPTPEQFVINPHAPADYDRIWAALKTEGRAPRQTVHLWTYGKTSAPASTAEFEQAQEPGVHSLLCMAQVLARSRQDEEPHHLWVISNSAFAVQAGEGTAFEKAGVSGVLKTLPLEIPGLACTQVDLDLTGTADHAGRLCREFGAVESYPEICYRDGVRFRALLGHVEAPEETRDPGLLKGGCYVISGGVGGIGREIARILLTEYQARLLIIGRSPAGTVEERLRDLRNLGGEVAYVSTDITDLAGVNAVIRETETRWGRPLDGIFHLAGTLESRLFIEETRETLGRSLRAKTTGAWVLHQIAQTRPGTLVVNFSSLLGYFGGYQYGAYAAANAFLEGLSHHQRSLGLRSCCLQWSSWTNTGMNQGLATEEAATRAKGYLPLTLREGIDSLRFALQVDHPQLLIGLNGTNPNIRPLLETAPAEAPAAENEYVEPRTETERKLARIWQDLLKRPQMGVRDNFFEIGGRSLLAARIFAQIEKVFGRSLPIASLFKAPTIEQLAVLIEGGASSFPVCQVEPLQREGTRPPFFCIPGGASDIIVFRPLADLLGPDQPFYGLQAHGLDGTKTDAPIIHITELAGYFIKEIRAIQPEGPYQLGGHCFGALLAYEIARQLEAQGQSVALLALLDPTATVSLDLGFFHSFKPRVQYFIRLSLRMSLLEKIKFVGALANHLVNEKLVGSHRIQHTIDRLRILHEGYKLQPYPGRATLFLAADSRHEFYGEKDVRLILGRLAQGGTEIQRVAGNHHTMLQDPRVRDLAEKLKHSLLQSAADPREAMEMQAV